MEVGVAVSNLADTTSAAGQAIEHAMAKLSAPPDLVVVFFTSEHGGAANEIAEAIGSASDAAVLGTSAHQLIGAPDRRPSLLVWAAHLPDCRIDALSLSLDETPNGSAIVGLPPSWSAIDSPPGLCLLLADAFSFRSQQFIHLFNDRYPRTALIGGSTSVGPGDGVVLIDSSSTQRFGAKGVLIGGVDVETVVAHASHEIGPALVVTAAEDNMIYGLGGKPPLERLREALGRLPADQAMGVVDGVCLGLALEDVGEVAFPDECVVRDVSFANLESGAIAVDLPVAIGSVVRFHVADPEAGRLTLQDAMNTAKKPPTAPKGILGFASGQFGPLQGLGLAGMVCAEQFTTVSSRAAIQNRTAALALFR